MNWRKPAYLAYASARGYRFPSMLAQCLRDYKRGVTEQITAQALRQLLAHCQKSVPYYARFRGGKTAGDDRDDPREELQRLPILTKADIRAHFAQLQSADLCRRKWGVNTSGGSTGEPVQFIQDAEYNDRSAGISLFYNWL